MGFTYTEKCNAIIKWAKASAPNFNTHWVKTVQLDIKDFDENVLTPKQMQGVDRIIISYSITVSDWL